MIWPDRNELVCKGNPQYIHVVVCIFKLFRSSMFFVDALEYLIYIRNNAQFGIERYSLVNVLYNVCLTREVSPR